ncbi:MAG TPA: cysteine-rich CWC family protein [Blastocatellia bacterium]|nr:cysteine-rich CWC family protein [Blastocatellia bacterium]
MLRKLMELILPDTRAPRECEACGKPFVCGASLKGCWCLQIKVSADALQQLREHYKRCLCLECLTKLASSSRRDAGY